MKLLALSQRKDRKQRSGFLLMEVMLALMIFAIMSVGFTKALSAMRANSRLIEERMMVAQIVDSALTEAMTLSTLEEGETITDVEENEMEILTVIEPLEFENEEGKILQQMFRITVTGRWYKNNQEHEVSAEGWRYLQLYKP
ncbi:prepilin-type N-terminal cleavage/methylation domain-containing protein [bacterium]|nr:prepilin-type N-terminal cleavage/methylation domain-containing protein [Akkermansiaceae bacterium]MDA7898559.1 prepilin-type N-terminal cleavage/methylation domain-containing protein [bacterium]MDA7862824.1 prepilin-type N-terminal cleavage/methylation domain-containing protein [Akkermansiaceae bacterium]MDA7864459.1 prepilin-type N-terminal cleavage/methylation domain-containing protein [Akkermansiaceae bacterium]MDA7936208.1 prepilin-type N-terminal cleavage/methylation domain-containing 